ncbi:MAG: ABC transporter permease [Candidatus Coatesbacteria bacterium]
MSRKELALALLLAVLCAATAALNPRFLGVDNLQNMARLTGLFGIFSIGLGAAIITGGIDLSVGSLFALQGVLLAMALREWNWGWAVAVAAALAGPAALGWLHGWLVVRMRLQPFIVTLCGLLVYRGAARFLANDETKGFGSGNFGPLRALAAGDVLGVPMSFVLLLAVAAVTGVLLNRSVYGRWLLATGRNEEAARYSGVPTARVIMGAYVVSGALAGVSGILIAFYTNSISPASHGNFYELYGIAAAVLGGCTLRGGEGSVTGIVIGTAILQVLQNLVNLLGIPSSLNFAVMGAVILLGVLADELVGRWRPGGGGGRPNST